MQRVTGSDIEIHGGGQELIQIPGHVHEVERLLTAARDAGMEIAAMEEPRVTASMVEHRPLWRRKIGRCALLLLALTKPSAG